MSDAAESTAPASGLSLVGLVRARLRDVSDPRPWNETYGVLDLAGGRPGLVTPCVAVLVLAEDGGRGNLAADADAGVVQRATATLATVLGLGAPRGLGDRGGAARDVLQPALDALRGALLGWAPGGPFTPPATTIDPVPLETRPPPPAARWRPLVWRRGRLLDLDQGRVWWQDEWETSRLIAGAAPEPDPPPAPDGVYVRLPGVAPEMVWPGGAG